MATPFTSDLLPSDVIGLSVYNQHTGVFDWKPGPVFGNVVLRAIHRAPHLVHVSTGRAIVSCSVVVIVKHFLSQPRHLGRIRHGWHNQRDAFPHPQIR